MSDERIPEDVRALLRDDARRAREQAARNLSGTIHYGPATIETREQAEQRAATAAEAIEEAERPFVNHVRQVQQRISEQVSQMTERWQAARAEIDGDMTATPEEVEANVAEIRRRWLAGREAAVTADAAEETRQRTWAQSVRAEIERQAAEVPEGQTPFGGYIREAEAAAQARERLGFDPREVIAQTPVPEGYSPVEQQRLSPTFDPRGAVDHAEQFRRVLAAGGGEHPPWLQDLINRRVNRATPVSSPHAQSAAFDVAVPPQLREAFREALTLRGEVDLQSERVDDERAALDADLSPDAHVETHHDRVVDAVRGLLDLLYVPPGEGGTEHDLVVDGYEVQIRARRQLR